MSTALDHLDANSGINLSMRHWRCLILVVRRCFVVGILQFLSEYHSFCHNIFKTVSSADRHRVLRLFLKKLLKLSRLQRGKARIYCKMRAL